MATKVSIGGEEYAAIISGEIADRTWDGRKTMAITLEMTHADADELFVDDVEWGVVFDGVDSNTNQPVHEEYDYSAFNVAGDIIDHRDGTLTVKMGKPTDLEDAYELLYGGEE